MRLRTRTIATKTGAVLSLWLMLVATLAFSPGTVSAGAPPRRIEVPAPSSLINNGESSLPTSGLQVPFELYGNLILLKVQVNGSAPLTLVLDTGASVSVLDEASARSLGLKLKYYGGFRDVGFGENKTKLYRIKNVTFGLLTTEFVFKTVGASSLDYLEKHFGRPLDGVLGRDFFKRYVTEIDYATRTLTLYEPKKFSHAGEAAALPLEFVSGLPAVRATVVLAGLEPLDATFAIDTGMFDTLVLMRPFTKKHKLLERIRTVPSTSFGVGGRAAEVQGRVQALRLGPFELGSPVTSFSQAKKGVEARLNVAGIIGGEVLRRFRVTLDYKRRQLFLEPNDALREPFESDMSGLVLIAEGPQFNTIRVEEIESDSVAAEAGLQEGDVIEAIDGRSASELTLWGIYEKLRQDGKEFLFTIRRGDASQQIRLKTKRRI